MVSFEIIRYLVFVERINIDLCPLYSTRERKISTVAITNIYFLFFNISLPHPFTSESNEQTFSPARREIILICGMMQKLPLLALYKATPTM